MSDWVYDSVKLFATAAYQHALDYQLRLTKPPGSLGMLEDMAARLCGMQNTNRPRLARIQISVFAADHGIANEGVSAFPQVVTAEMVRNFASGGAAISVLAKQLGAELEVVNVGVANDVGPVAGVIQQSVGAGTANFCKGPAMTRSQLNDALEVGRASIARAMERGIQLFIAGDMGIANTSSATAIACALMNIPAAELAGPGTGLSQSGVNHKAEVIQSALDMHADDMETPLDVLRCLGGFEIAAIVGAYIAAAQEGVPIVVDGFIATAAALLASRINPGVGTWWFFGHRSAEPGHCRILEELHVTPMLDLGMRLGEGSGAAVAVPLLRQACVLHTKMATFEQAGVSEG